MIRRLLFENELTSLHDEIIKFGSLVEESIDKAITALKTQDTKLANEIIVSDDILDAYEKNIERLCIMIIATQQPIARDLRNISTALKIVTDMERIGDHASDIAELSVRHANAKYIKPIIDIPKMAHEARLMVKDSISAYVTQNIDLANAVCKRDDIVDEFFSKITLELISLMKNDANVIDQAIDLMLITKYLERIADHATNIAEWAIFNATGEYEESVKRHLEMEE